MEFTEMQAQEAARSAGIDLEKERFDLKALTAGMNAELEHGTASPDTNITNDDPVMTAKLAAAHLRVSPFYYASGRGLKAWEASLRRGVKVKSSKTEHKTLSFRTEEYDEESGIFSGYAAVYGNIDSGGDIIEPGAFTKTIAEGWERVKILALHNDCWLPIGRPLELREDSNGLFIKAKISDTSMGRDIKVLLKDGVLTELSIGYDPIVFDYDENGIRHLREVKLWEVSVVTWAMNPEATITDYKQATDAASFYAQRKYDDADMAREFKALSATNPAAGGYLIPEIYLDQIIELLYSKTVIFELGAQKVPMANGNLNIPKMTGGARATWGGEARKIAKTQPTYGNIRLSAKRLEAIVPQTRELLMSTNYSADQLFANDLTRRMELGLDFGAMFGKGGEFQPLGVFTDKEVEHVDAKTLSNDDLADSNGKITADFPVFVRSKVLAKNVDDNKLGWAFNSVLEGYLMNLKTTTGAYIYRDEMNTGKLLGFPYRVSNQITTDTSGLTELAFGNWADLLVGEQMGLETYTTLDGSWVDEEGNQHNAFEENLAATRALMYVDIAARHKESFLHVTNIKAV